MKIYLSDNKVFDFPIGTAFTQIDLEGADLSIINTVREKQIPDPNNENETITVPAGSIQINAGDDNSYPYLQLSSSGQWKIGIGDKSLGSHNIDRLMEVLAIDFTP